MKLDRLLGILTILLQRDKVTAPYLAERFEVTRRTISRDVDALCRAGIPIVTRQGGGGGISIAEGYKLDKSVLTSDELANIISALKGLHSVSDTTGIADTLDKLSPDSAVSLRESIIIDLASHSKTSLTEKITLIKQAIRENKTVTFDYYYEKGCVSREIEPYYIVFKWTSWYVFGYCRTREDFRLFRLSRLWSLVMGCESFTPCAIPPERMDFDRHFTDTYRFTALFDPSARYQLIDDYGLYSFTEEVDGLLFSTGYTNRAHIVKWLLSFGDKVKVLSPYDLAQEIKRTALEIVKNYDI